MNEIETDVRTLLECLKCHQHQPQELSRSLMTLSSFLTTNEGAKEYLQEEGGVVFVYKLLLRTKSSEVRHSCMFCLACAIDRNGQKILTNIEFFKYLHQILYDQDKTNVKMRQTCVFLLLCLVANNSIGQKLSRESNCLHELIKMLRNSIQKTTNGEDGPDKDIWCSVTSALSMCVNNPQNEDNQRECCVILPLAFQFIQNMNDPVFIRPLLAFIGLTVASNVHNQERVRKIGGIDILVTRITDWIRAIDEDIDFLSLAVNSVNALDSCIAENDENCREFMDSNGMHVLFTILHYTELDNNEQLQIVIALGHALQFNSGSNIILDIKQQRLLINILTKTQDEELMKATKYVLQNISANQDITGNERNERLDVVDNERDTNNTITEKITELSRKLEILNEDITSRENNAFEIKDWLKKKGNPEFLDEKNNLKTIHDGKTPSRGDHECKEQNQKEKEAVCPNIETPKKFNKENMDLMSMFADYFLRSSFRLNDLNINNNSHMTCSLPRAQSNSSAAQKDILSNDMKRDQICSCAGLSCCNATQHPDITENCTSFSYRNKSTILQDCCHTHSNNNDFINNLNNNQDPTPISKLYKLDHQCQHSTPKDKCDNEFKERVFACMHSELCKHPEQSPIIDPMDGQEIYDCSFTFDHVVAPKYDNHNKDKNSNTISFNEIKSTGDAHLYGNEGTDMKVNQSATINELRNKIDAKIKNFIITDGSPAKSHFTVSAKIDAITMDESPMKSHLTVPLKISCLRNSANTNNFNTKDGDLLEAIQSSTVIAKDMPSFVVPSNPPLKRRIRHTPSLSSAHSTIRNLSTFTETLTTKNQIYEEKLNTMIESGSCHSPAFSEFDLNLLRTAQISNSNSNTTKRSSLNDNPHLNNVLLSTSSPSPSTVSTILTNVSSQSPKPSVDRGVCPETDSHLMKVCKESCEERMNTEVERKKTINKCPGCCIQTDNMVINSRTFTILLESSNFTCSFHKRIRNLEREFIRKYKAYYKKAIDPPNTSPRVSSNEGERLKDIYVFSSPDCTEDISAVSDEDCIDEETVVWRNRLHSNQERRHRIAYTQQEIENLIEGVKRMGRSWKLILLTYTFHPTRTSVDLKDKYRQLLKKEMMVEKVKARKQKQPFSMCEERRLRRGIKLFGYNWKAILLNSKFCKTRTAEDLRNKWRNMNKAKMIKKELEQ